MKLVHAQDRKLFGYGVVVGSVILSIALASVPKQSWDSSRQRSTITDDTAIYQNMSEIRVPREAAPNFDRDIQKLSSLEPRYQEKLPLAKSPRIQAPMQRLAKKPYHYSGAAKYNQAGTAGYLPPPRD